MCLMMNAVICVTKLRKQVIMKQQIAINKTFGFAARLAEGSTACTATPFIDTIAVKIAHMIRPEKVRTMMYPD